MLAVRTNKHTQQKHKHTHSTVQTKPKLPCTKEKNSLSSHFSHQSPQNSSSHLYQLRKHTSYQLVHAAVTKSHPQDEPHTATNVQKVSSCPDSSQDRTKTTMNKKSSKNTSTSAAQPSTTMTSSTMMMTNFVELKNDLFFFLLVTALNNFLFFSCI